MSSVDALISTAEARAAQYASETDFLINELRSFIKSRKTTLSQVPGTIQVGDAYVYDLNLAGIDLPEYVTPVKDATAMPVYEPPLAPLPTAPNLAPIGAITMPVARTEPTLNTSGLFQQVAPSANLPDFNEAEPDLHITELVAEMDAIAAPVLQTIDIPTLTLLNIRDTPTLDLPTYVAPAAPDALRDPVDYGAAMEATYSKMLPEMQAFIDDKVSVWVTQYSPEYADWTTLLQAKVTAALSGEVLPDQFETAMYTRARGRIEQEFQTTEQGLLETYSKRGFFEPPGALLAGLHAGRLKGAESLANTSTDIYIERRKTEVQHMQFVMNLASTQIQSVRNFAIAYAGVVGNSIQQSVNYASSVTDKLTKIYDHLIARAEMSIKIMEALNAQYEVKLKAALSALDGFRLELEAEKTKKDVEIAQLQFVESQIKIQELEVQRYSALIDAVAKKSAMEELKLKGYEIRSDIFKNTTNAKLAAFDVYKASIDGDKAKMEGEKLKLEVYEELIKTDQINLESQVKAMEATEKANNAQIEIFRAGGEVYKLDSEAALTKFNAYAEVKKLTQSIYGQELNNAIESFKANLEIPKVLMNAMIEQYKLSVQAAISEAELDIKKLSISERASEQAVGAYQAMASSALGSLNSVVSSAVSASA